jgi:hypothetical protein
MAFNYSPKIVRNGMIMCLDAANRRSYIGSGTAWNDISGQGNNGTLVGGPTFSSTNNGSIVFDATDDTVTTTIPLITLSALSNFTMDCWIKIPSYPTAAPPNAYNKTTRNGVVIGAAYYSGTAIYWTGNATGTSFDVYGYIRGADASRNTALYSVTSLDKYYNFTLVNSRSDTTLKLYVNGTLYSSVAGPTQEYNAGLYPTAGNIGINKPQVDGGGENVYSYLAFTMGSSKIYTSALSAVDILNNYNALKGRFNLL